MNISIQTLKDNEAWLREQFDSQDSIAFTNVSMTQLSVARYYGGCKYNGSYYVYNSTDDSLIREDVITKLSKHLKLKKSKLVKQAEQELAI